MIPNCRSYSTSSNLTGVTGLSDFYPAPSPFPSPVPSFVPSTRPAGIDGDGVGDGDDEIIIITIII